MKKTTIDKKETIQEILDEVQKRAKTRTISYEDMVETLDEIDKRLNISKAAKKGVKVLIDYHAQHFPACYHGQPESTYFQAEYNGKAWAITNIKRGYTTQTPNKAILITFTDAAKAAIIRRMEEMSI